MAGWVYLLRLDEQGVSFRLPIPNDDLICSLILPQFLRTCPMNTSALTRALHSAPSESMSSTLTICAGMFGAFVRALLCNSSISAESLGYRMASARPVASWRNITPATPKGTRSAASATTSCTAEVLRAQGGLGGAFARFARSVYRVKPRFYAECVRGERVCAEARM